MEIRLKIFSVFLALAFLLVAGRLFYWQVLKADDLSSQARNQYERGYNLQAERGDILAADGTWLSATSTAWLLYVSPKKLDKNPSEIATKIAQIIVKDKDDEEYIVNLKNEEIRLKSLLSKNLVWVALKNKLDTSVKEEIDNLGIAGLGFEEEEKRYYPEGSVSAQLLGFVGKDTEGNDKGYFGLEGYYDITLTGRPGFKSRQADPRGIPIFLGSSKESNAISGVSLVTNIDKGIQIDIENKLIAGISKYGASAGSVIVTNPKNGAILAMSSYPSYDPSSYINFSDELFLNPVVSSSFEPGSIFKVLVMASALDAEAVEPETKCDICSGPVKIDRYTIETWNNQYYTDSTMTDVIKHSDNVGMVFTAQKLGKEKLYDYLTKFGIGKATGIDLQGELTPNIREKNAWGPVELATTSFGQGIAATPIQMVKAVSAIANNGILYRPQVVDKFYSSNWEEDINPEVEGRVISEKAAHEITQMMVEAAKNGEAKWTYLRGFKVAGKTGTAQIPIEGHYDAEKTIASFVGFAPYDDPKFLMLVTLREPQSSQWASETAAPLWYDIAKNLFLHFGMQPEK